MHRDVGKRYIHILALFIFVEYVMYTSRNCFSQDHAELEAEIERLRDNLKPKVAALHKLEGRHHAMLIFQLYNTGYIFTGRAEVKGFDLKGLRAEEVIVMGSKTK